MRTYRNPMMDRPISELMEFDHVVAVMPDGRVIDTDEGFNYLDVHAPEVFLHYDGPFIDAQVSREDTAAMVDYLGQQGWEALCGWSRQYLTQKNDPIMHPSEFIGGRFEERIREEPGYWVQLAVDIHPNEDDPEHESNGGSGESKSVGWIVARKIGSEDEIAARTQWVAENLAPWHVDPSFPRRPMTDVDASMSRPTSLYRGPVESAARNILSTDLFKTAHFDTVKRAGEQDRYLDASTKIAEDDETYSVQPDNRIYRVRAVLMPKKEESE
jgi:hypothetical protein